MRIVSALVGLAAFGLVAACQPPTTYNRGLDLAFHPSSKADAQERIVYSAIELKQESDQQAIKDAGGIYLGDLDVTAEKSTTGPAAGGSTLSGRVSLDVASRGGTHFYLKTLDAQNDGGRGHRTAQTTHAHYVVYRVEPQAWARLDAKYRPEGPVAKAAPTAMTTQ